MTGAGADPQDIYRPSTIKKKRQRRTYARVDQLDSQIMHALAADHPQSIRHVFYLMTNPTLPEPVPKTDYGHGNGYRAVQYRMKMLRRQGILPYHWVTDMSRRGFHTPTYGNKSEFLRRVKGLYRADLWEMSEYYCEVWCESRSIAGVIQDDCNELAVSLYPSGGFSSISFAFQAAECINDECRGRPVVIYYIGDYDPSGVLIDKSIELELRQHLKEGIDLQFVRLGITKEQAAGLPDKPRKTTEKRSPHVERTVEAEAMPAATMRALLRQNIEALLPPDALAVSVASEESAREFFDSIAQVLRREDVE